MYESKITQRPQGLMVSKLATMIESVPDLYTPGWLGCSVSAGQLHVAGKLERQSSNTNTNIQAVWPLRSGQLHVASQRRRARSLCVSGCLISPVTNEHINNTTSKPY
jgi:hypothetical protein